MVSLGSLGNNCYEKSSRKNIFTRILNSNSSFHGNLGEPILLHVFLLGALFFVTNSQNIWFKVPLEIAVGNEVPARTSSLGLLFLTIISRLTISNRIF
jgi:hypothetical protein